MPEVTVTRRMHFNAAHRVHNPALSDDENRRLTANGFLTVDGRVIYQMTDFSLE